MRYLPLIILTACMNKVEVPQDVHHDVSGTITQVIKLELALPDTVLTGFTQQCTSDCNAAGDTTKQCIDTCVGGKQQQYINDILNLIKQFNAAQSASTQPTQKTP